MSAAVAGRRRWHAHWTRDLVLDAIRDYAERYGTPPSARDWNVAMARRDNRPDLVERFYSDNCWPHYGTVQALFGRWSHAIREAGFSPRSPGIKRADLAEPRPLPTAAWARYHAEQLAGGEGVDEMTLVISMLLVGGGADALIAFTSFDEAWVRERLDRLRASGLWDGETLGVEEGVEDCPEVYLSLVGLVAEGKVVRETIEHPLNNSTEPDLSQRDLPAGGNPHGE